MPAYFDSSKVTVEDQDGDEIEDFDVTVVDEDGKEATLDDLKTPGTWTVTVTVNATNDDGEVVAGSEYVTVKVGYTTMTEANVFVSFDGRNIADGQTDSQAVYSGEDQLDKLSVKVVSGDKELAEGTDYEVKVTNSKDEEVKEIVDADLYTITVKGLSFDTSYTANIDVQKVELTTLIPSNPFAVDTANEIYYLNHTGEELEPEYTFEDAEGNEWKLSADEYELTYKKGGTSADLKDEGTYTIDNVSVTAKNFRAGASVALPTGYTIVVTSNRVFADVPNDAYYAEAVATAKQEGYIEGMGGSNMFMPNNGISRADIVVVLYRMAGGSLDSMKDGMTNEEVSYVTGFGDVDKNAYYAKALAWAAKAGIVTGYEDGNFGPADYVTVEQFVTMLARYAELCGNYEGVEDVDAVLGDVADGDQVSEFGQEAVAWAIDNGYLAQGGADVQPQSQVSRGRAITVAVRYQPEQNDGLINLPGGVK